MSITLSDLQAMKQKLHEAIDRESLVDMRDVDVNQDLPIAEKIIQFILTSKNPYLYRYGDRVVRLNFSSTDITFEDRMKEYFGIL